MYELDSRLRKPSVLIVDDDATMRLLMREALTDELYMIYEAENGLEGLEKISVIRPDLVLLDVKMQGMDGFEVCAEIRRVYGETEISIVMVTALEDSESIEKAYHMGATDFLSKPINWDTFPYRIQYLIKARSAIVELNNYKRHLEYMEHVSRIITQNKNKGVIMQETMFAMLEIFSADRVALIKPDEYNENKYIVDCEVVNNSEETIDSLGGEVTDICDPGLFIKARKMEYPVWSRSAEENPAPELNKTFKQKLISALHLKYTQNWYLVIQQNADQAGWTNTDVETFYKISLRLTNMLSLHLLTEDISRSERLLKQAQKIGRLGNWNWNVKSNCLAWSDEVYQIYGVRRDAYIPEINKYIEVEFEEDQVRLIYFDEIKNNIRSMYQIDHRVRTIDNNVKWLHEECVGIYDREGELQEVNGIVQDITEAHIRKEQEAHDNKMDAIGKLTSGLAHDFGNLMTVAKGNLDLLENELSRGKDFDEDSRQLLEDAYSAVSDSVELTKQLLTFSRKKSISPVFINIEQSINQFRNLLKNTLGDRVSMSIKLASKLPEIYVNPSQFESSLLNVIINARNAMVNGGEIEINAQEMTAAQIQGLFQSDHNILVGDYVCVCVRDNGTGMNEDILRQAVEPFYTTRVNHGTGLGLSMVYSFLKQSGGELIIQSQPNKGTTVNMLFPIREVKGGEPVNKDTITILNDSKLTILVVEDRDAVRQFAVHCLTRPGVTVLQANNAVIARKYLKSAAVDLLFTDIVMPGDMNGQELANWAENMFPDLKILLTTAMLESGGNHVDEQKRFPLIEKPYSKDELADAITACLA